MFRALLAAALLLAAPLAQACMFVRDIPPEAWYQWSSALFAGEVTGAHEDAEKGTDTISLRITETFKGPAADRATLSMSVRLRKLCKLELPKPGERILVALNEHNDASWVPLDERRLGRIRQERKP